MFAPFSYMAAKRFVTGAQGDLIVLAGTTTTLTMNTPNTAQVYQYRSIRIEAGATLLLVGATPWFIGCRGDFFNQGLIRAIQGTARSAEAGGSFNVASPWQGQANLLVNSGWGAGGTGGGGYVGSGAGWGGGGRGGNGAEAGGGGAGGVGGANGANGGGVGANGWNTYGGAGGAFNPNLSVANPTNPVELNGGNPSFSNPNAYGGTAGSGGGGGGGGGVFATSSHQSGGGGGGGGGLRGIPGGSLCLRLEGRILNPGTVTVAGSAGTYGGAGGGSFGVYGPPSPGGGGGGGGGGKGGTLQIYHRDQLATGITRLLNGGAGGLGGVDGYGAASGTSGANGSAGTELLVRI